MRFDDPALPAGTGDVTPHPRRGLWAVLALFAVMVLVLWGLTRTIDRPNDQSLGADIPEDRTAAVDLVTSTTVVDTTVSTTTGAPRTTSEQGFVNDVRGSVLGDDVIGLIVQIVGRSMREIDLSTGAVQDIDLKHVFSWEDPESGIVVDGRLIAVNETSIIIADLSDGSQLEPRSISADSVDMHVAGRAGVGSRYVSH